MINEFKELEMRDSAVIYASNLEQIKKLYEKDPIQAGELAISLCEMALTGEISSDDFMIELMLENYKAIRGRAANAYDERKEVKEQAKKDKMQLDKIAELARQGKKQTEIAAIIGVSKQTIAYRLNKIRTEYPELLVQIEDPEAGEPQNLISINAGEGQKSKIFTF